MSLFKKVAPIFFLLGLVIFYIKSSLVFDLTKSYQLDDKSLKKVSSFFKLLGELNCEAFDFKNEKYDFSMETKKDKYFFGPYNKILKGFYLRKGEKSFFCKNNMSIEGVYSNEDEMELARYNKFLEKLKECF